MSTLSKVYRWFGTVLVIGFMIFWVYAIFQIRPWATTERRAALIAASGESYLLLRQMESPPQADSLSAIVVTSSFGRRGPAATATQEFTAEGYFADTVAWYRERLEAEGWQPFDQNAWRDFYVDLCKPPWMLVIERDASFEDSSEPFHRYTLRLSWSLGFRPERCPYPGD